VRQVLPDAVLLHAHLYTLGTQIPQRPHEIFVSYSTKDGALVDKIVRALEIRGRIGWIAPRDIPPGSPSWAEPIVTAIAGSRLVLVLLTEKSMPSLDVMREVTSRET